MHIIHVNTNNSNNDIEIANNIEISNNNTTTNNEEEDDDEEENDEDDCNDDDDEDIQHCLNPADPLESIEEENHSSAITYNDNLNLTSITTNIIQPTITSSSSTSSNLILNGINLTLNDEPTTASTTSSSTSSSSSFMLTNYLFGAAAAAAATQVPHIIQAKEEPGLLITTTPTTTTTDNQISNCVQRPSSLALFPFIHHQQQQQQQQIGFQSPLEMVQISSSSNNIQNLNNLQMSNSRSASAFYSPSNYPSTSSTNIYSEPNTPGSATSNLTYQAAAAAAAYSFSPSTLDFGMLWSPHWSLGCAAAATVAANEINVGDLSSPLDYQQGNFSPNSLANCHHNNNNNTQFLTPTGSRFTNHFHNQSTTNTTHIIHPTTTPTNFPPGLSNAAVVAAEFMTRNSVTNSVVFQGMRQQNAITGCNSTRKGGRRPREIEEDSQNALTEEDRDKRAKRRQRNKEAAARCRKRRLDLMTDLQQQVEQLKDENRQKQMVIEQLLTQKTKLEQMVGCSGNSSQQQQHCIMQQQKEMNDSILNSNNNSFQNSMVKDIQQQQQQQIQQQQRLMNSHQLIQQQQQSLTNMCNSPDPQKPQHCNNNNININNNNNSSGGGGGPSNNDIMLFKEEEDLMQNSASPSSQYSNSMLLNNDPVISDGILMDRPIKRLKMEDECLTGLNDTYERPTTLSLGGHQFDGINLNTITTPSHGLITPSLAGNDYGHLLHQRTFLTPIVSAPMLIPNTSAPINGDLRQL